MPGPPDSLEGLAYCSDHLAEVLSCPADVVLEGCEQELMLARKILIEATERLARTLSNLLDGEVTDGRC